MLLADPAPVAALVQGSGLAEARARRIVYVLAITKAIAPYDETAPRERPRAAEATEDGAASADSASSEAGPDAPAAPGGVKGTSHGDGDGMHSHLDRLHNIPPPPDDLADEIRQRWLRLIAKGRLIENQNYFEMLELDKDAKATDARNKFYQMAKEWHPDRLPPEMESIREYAQIIFSYMSEASGVLGDEQQRVKYVQTVREGGGTPATERLMQAILDTAMEYERVLVLSRRHEYDEALEALRKIIAWVRDEPDYHALYAWLLMQ